MNARLRTAAYWIGATVLIIVLLTAIFGLGELVTARRWPFAPVWGSAMAALGIVLVLIGALYRFLPAVVVGGGVFVGGVAYSLTHEVWFLIVPFGVGVFVTRILLSRLNQGPRRTTLPPPN